MPAAKHSIRAIPRMAFGNRSTETLIVAFLDPTGVRQAVRDVRESLWRVDPHHARRV